MLWCEYLKSFIVCVLSSALDKDCVGCVFRVVCATHIFPFISVLLPLFRMEWYNFGSKISFYLLLIKLKTPSGEDIHSNCHSGAACCEVICFRLGLTSGMLDKEGFLWKSFLVYLGVYRQLQTVLCPSWSMFSWVCLWLPLSLSNTLIFM